jgi:fructoselysine-6-P-deglycase FrlB-like protein
MDDLPSQWHCLVVRALILVACAAAVLVSGCGGSNAVVQMVTSTPSAAALQVAESNASEAAVSMQSYFDAHGSYQGATADAIRMLDASLSPTVSITGSGAEYCIESVVDGVAAALHGPGGTPAAGTC